MGLEELGGGGVSRAQSNEQRLGLATEVIEVRTMRERVGHDGFSMRFIPVRKGMARENVRKRHGLSNDEAGLCPSRGPAGVLLARLKTIDRVWCSALSHTNGGDSPQRPSLGGCSGGFTRNWLAG